MKITALKIQARNPNRVNVYLDGRFAFGLAKIEAIRLRVGQTLTEADVARLQGADAEAEAYEKALKLIGTRPRSEAEVRQKLVGRKVSPAVIAVVLERLRHAGLLDDQAFAAYWLENRAAFRPRSRRALRQELRQKGVSGEALEQKLAATDETEAAYTLAVRRARQYAELPYPDFRRKLGMFLARHGFDYETVEPVVERVWRERQDAQS